LLLRLRVTGFGEKQGNVNIIKTIISDVMLYENQKPLFDSLKSAFREANKERYGSIISGTAADS